MQIWHELRHDTRREHWKEGVLWLLWSLVGGLLPVWLTIIVQSLTTKGFELSVLTDKGEFALYTASYAAGTLCILLRDFRNLKNITFPSRSILGLISCIFLITSAAIFMLVATALADLDLKAVRVLTLTMFSIGMLLSFFVIVAENVRSMPDIGGMAQSQFQQLGSDLDKLKGPTNE